MPITIVLAKAHTIHLQDEELRQEYESIRHAFLSIPLNYQEGTINFVFLKGVYSDFDKKMTTVCVFVNKLGKPIKEIHGVLKLRFRSVDAEIAAATMDFDEDFTGILQPDEGLLFHINLPVKGLGKDQEFFIQDIEGFFDEVRFTPAE
jgi:hypothetical protein